MHFQGSVLELKIHKLGSKGQVSLVINESGDFAIKYNYLFLFVSFYKPDKILDSTCQRSVLKYHETKITCPILSNFRYMKMLK